MPTLFTLSGVILEQGTEKRLSNSTIKLEAGTELLSTESDANGNFIFPALTEPDLPEGQDKYSISLYAYNNGGLLQEPQPLKIDIEKGTVTYFQMIKMVNRGPISNGAGRIFLLALIIILSVLGFKYYGLHNHKSDESNKDVNTAVVQTLTSSLVDRITADSVLVGNFKTTNDSITATDYNFISSEYQQIKEAAGQLSKTAQIDTSLVALINGKIIDLNEAIELRKKPGILVALTGSKQYIKQVPNFIPSWFWTTIPGTYYEILFWSLFATLLRLIGNTSYYVSRNVFYRDSIPQKAALLFTIPLIALLITFVISFFKIAIAIGETNFVVDFSNPFISIILASLIGLAPWSAWEFMYGLAEKLFVSLKSWMGINDNNKEQSVEKEDESKESDAT